MTDRAKLFKQSLSDPTVKKGSNDIVVVVIVVGVVIVVIVVVVGMSSVVKDREHCGVVSGFVALKTVHVMMS